jgi:hypothetical protein
MFTLRGSPSPLNVLSIREPPARLGFTKATESSCLDLRGNVLSAKAHLRPSRDTERRRTMRKIGSGEGSTVAIITEDARFNHSQPIQSLRNVPGSPPARQRATGMRLFHTSLILRWLSSVCDTLFPICTSAYVIPFFSRDLTAG